ncbi:MAG: MarR family transcriptional regulator [Meiothermus sp.]
MSQKVSEPHLSAWKALLRTHPSILRKIEADLAEQGQIPLGLYDVLLELSSAPNRRLRMAELAERVVLSRSGLTRLVERLEGEGYLIRENSPTDRRGVEAVLTDAGLKALKAAWPTYAKGINTCFARHFTADEAEMLRGALERVLPASEEKN